MRRVVGILVAAAATSALVAACSGSHHAAVRSDEPARYATDATFTMATQNDITPFDPYRNLKVLGDMALAYDSLVNVQVDGKVVSGVAESWDANANQATFTLKAGVTCSDGTQLTASQVAKDLDFVKNPNNQSFLYGTFVPDIPFTVTADNATRTVHVKMQRPFGFLLQTIGAVPIVCAKAMANPALLKNTSDGTGPFVLTGAVPGESYTFTVRKGYNWGPDGASTDAPGTPSKVVLRIVTNETTAANLLLAGELNAASILGPDQQRLRAAGMAHSDSPSLDGELWYNQRDGRPGADRAVRRALTLALNRVQLVKVSTSGKGTPATGLVVATPKPCSGNTVTGQFPTYDPTQAAAILEQDGWVKGPNGTRSKNGKPLKMDLHYLTTLGSTGTAAAELIAQQWEAIGVQVKITGDDTNGLGQVMFQTGNFDAYWDGFGFNLPTQVVPFVSGPVPPQGQNFAGMHNATYQRLAAQAAALPAPQACTPWNQAEQALFQDFDVIPVSNSVAPTFFNKGELQISGQSFVATSIRVYR